MDQKETNETSNVDLDELAVRILTLMNEFISCKRNIQNYIRSGCLDLAKSRYIAGNRNISALQLPGEDSVGVEAKFRVVRSASCDDFSKYRHVEHESNRDDESLTETLDDLNLNSDGTSKQVLRFSKDPLQWFGFLVPRNLRQSKVTFEKCLEIVVECANIQSELEYRLTEYSKLKKLSFDQQWSFELSDICVLYLSIKWLSVVIPLPYTSIFLVIYIIKIAVLSFVPF